MPNCPSRIPYLMLFRIRRYFRTKSTVFTPVQLRSFWSKVDFFSSKRKRILGAFHRCFYLRSLISNANAAEVRVRWRRITTRMQQIPLFSQNRSSTNTHLSSICVTDQTSKVKTAMKSPENSLSFPRKKSTLDKKRRSCTGVNTVLLVRKYLQMRNNIR